MVLKMAFKSFSCEAHLMQDRSGEHLHEGDEWAAGVAVENERPFAKSYGALNVDLRRDGGGA